MEWNYKDEMETLSDMLATDIGEHFEIDLDGDGDGDTSNRSAIVGYIESRLAPLLASDAMRSKYKFYRQLLEDMGLKEVELKKLVGEWRNMAAMLKFNLTYREKKLAELNELAMQSVGSEDAKSIGNKYGYWYPCKSCGRHIQEEYKGKLFCKNPECPAYRIRKFNEHMQSEILGTQNTTGDEGRDDDDDRPES